MSWNLLKDKNQAKMTEKISSKTENLYNNVIELKDNKKDNNSNTKFNPEQYKSDISIYPNYTDLNCLPYYVVCRRRVHKKKKQMVRQFNREILHMAMMQTHAIAGVRIDRNFSIGFPMEALNLPDFATKDERLLINKIMNIYLRNMFRDQFQKGYLSILYSCGPSPLKFWGTNVENGYIRRVTDNEINSLALEVAGTNVSTTYIYTPKDRKNVLGIQLSFLIMVIKNMKKYFTFEITILDDKKMHRRFRVSNFQSATKIRPFSTSMPMGLSGGWNQIQFNLAEFCKKTYGSNYIETTRMQVHANCRIRRVYFADRLYQEDDLPDEYKISGLLRKCVREGDQQKQKKNNSKGSLGRISNSSRISSVVHEEAEMLSTIASEAGEDDDPPEEQTRLQIDIPAPEYEETDNLSTGRESIYYNELIEQHNQSEFSIEGSQEESKKTEY